LTTDEVLAAIHEVLTAEGFDRTSQASEKLTYRGTILAAKHQILVMVVFPCLKFTTFPKLYVLNAASELPGVAAHLDNEDSLCFAAPGSIVLDEYDPAGVVLLVLQQAIATLETCIAGEASSDVRAEFAQHWGDNRCLTAIPPDAPDGLAWLVVVSRGRMPQLTVLTRNDEGLNIFSTVPRRLRDRVQEPAYIIRLNCELDLPDGRRPPKTLASLVSWAHALQPGLPKRLLTAIQNRIFYKKNPTVFFLASNGCVGVELILPPLIKLATQRIGFQNKCLLEHSTAIQVRRWAASRFDSDFMLARNLGDAPSLRGRKIVLVGCGTIGSHLARFLAQGGAGHVGRVAGEHGQVKAGELWLVDRELLSPGNIGRHLLGPSHLDRPKAFALAGELAKQFPEGQIYPVIASALDKIELLTGADIVVDATGEETLSMAINSLLISLRPKAPDALYIALFGNGAAAQALFVSGNSSDGACRKCLHPVLFDAPKFYPIAAGWGAREVPAACGESAFLPYGVAASAIAAGLASRMIMEWTSGHISHSLRTLRVDPQATVDVPDQNPDPFVGCPCCGHTLAEQSKNAAE